MKSGGRANRPAPDIDVFPPDIDLQPGARRGAALPKLIAFGGLTTLRLNLSFATLGLMISRASRHPRGDRKWGNRLLLDAASPKGTARL